MKKDHLSYSQISVFNNCKQEYFYKYIQHLKPVRDGESLIYGKYFHRGMEFLYRSGDPHVAIQTVMEELQAIDITGWDEERLKELQWVNIVLEAQIMGYYEIFYLPDMEKGLKVVELEKQYNIPIKNPRTRRSSRQFTFMFIADGVLRDKNGGLWMLEYKTTSRFGDNYFDRLKFDNQITGNIIGLELMYGEPIKGVLYRVMKKPSIRQTKKETELEYFKRLSDLFSMEAGNYFVEDIQTRTLKDKVEFLEQLWFTQQDIANVRKQSRYTKNTSVCVLRNCPYLALCAKKDGCESMYAERTWVPQEEGEAAE